MQYRFIPHACYYNYAGVHVHMHCILQVGVSSTVELAQLLYDDRFDFQFTCGYSKQQHVTRWQVFINAIWLHFIFFQPHAELL